MRYCLLGPLQIHAPDGGIVLDVRGERRQLLLTLLLLTRNHSVSTKEIAEKVWPHERAKPAMVHVLITRVRAQLANHGMPDLIRSTNGGYAAALTPDDSLDVDDFLALVTEGCAYVENNPAMAVSLLTQALGMWSTPTVAGIEELPDWESVAALVESRWRAIDHRATAALSLGWADRVSAWMIEGIREAPLREPLWARWIRALHSAGRDVEAWDVYDRCRETFRRELQAEPGGEVRSAAAALQARRRDAPHEKRAALARVSEPTSAQVLKNSLLDMTEFAIAMGGYQHALHALTAVLQYPDLTPSDRARVLMQLGEVKYYGLGGGQPELAQALHFFAACDDRARAGNAALMLSRASWLNGDGTECRQALTTALDMLRQAPASVTTTEQLATAAGMLNVIGKGRQAVEMGQITLERATRQQNAALSRVLMNLGSARMGIGDASGIHDLRKGLEVKLRNDGWAAPVTFVNLSYGELMLGDLDAASRFLHRASQAAKSHGDAADERWIRSEWAMALFLQDKPDAAKRITETLIQESSYRQHYLDSQVRCVRAAIAHTQKRVQESLADAETALTSARRSGDPQLLTMALATAAHSRALNNDTTGANDLVDESLSSLGGKFVHPFVIRQLAGSFARLDRDVRDLEDAGPARSTWLEMAVTASAERGGIDVTSTAH